MKTFYHLFLIFLSTQIYAFGNQEQPPSPRPQDLIVEDEGSNKNLFFIDPWVYPAISALRGRTPAQWELTLDIKRAHSFLFSSKNIPEDIGNFKLEVQLPKRYEDLYQNSGYTILPIAIRPTLLYVLEESDSGLYDDDSILYEEETPDDIEEEVLPQITLEEDPKQFFESHLLELRWFNSLLDYYKVFLSEGLENWKIYFKDESNIETFFQRIESISRNIIYQDFPPPGPVFDRMVQRGERGSYFGGLQESGESLCARNDAGVAQGNEP